MIRQEDEGRDDVRAGGRGGEVGAGGKIGVDSTRKGGRDGR